MAIDLVGITEIAARARVKPDTVQKWRRRHPSFPTPVRQLASGPVWSWPDVAAWLAIPRPSGRPRDAAGQIGRPQKGDE
jgi:hypothetical protein